MLVAAIGLSSCAAYAQDEYSTKELTFGSLSELGVNEKDTAFVIVVNKDGIQKFENDGLKTVGKDELNGRPILGDPHAFVFQYVGGSTCVIYRSVSGTVKRVCWD
jgi:hypothetical protein